MFKYYKKYSYIRFLNNGTINVYGYIVNSLYKDLHCYSDVHHSCLTVSEHR